MPEPFGESLNTVNIPPHPGRDVFALSGHRVKENSGQNRGCAHGTDLFHGARGAPLLPGGGPGGTGDGAPRSGGGPLPGLCPGGRGGVGPGHPPPGGGLPPAAADGAGGEPPPPGLLAGDRGPGRAELPLRQGPRPARPGAGGRPAGGPTASPGTRCWPRGPGRRGGPWNISGGMGSSAWPGPGTRGGPSPWPRPFAWPR